MTVVGNASRSRGKRGGRSPSLAIGLALAAAVIAVLVALPVVQLLIYILRLAETPSVFQVWLQPGIGAVVANTAILVISASLASVSCAAVLAWLNERTDARIESLSGVLPILPLIVPAIAGAIGWTFLLSPSAGLINVLTRKLLALFGLDIDTGPFSIFNWPGMVFLSTGYLIPYAYVILAAAFRNVDPALEEASRVCGRGAWYTFSRVAIPSILPAIGNAFFVTVVVAVALFSIPVILGTPSRIEVLSVRIVRLLTTSYPPQLAPAVVLSAGFAVVLVGLTLVQARLAALGHATLGGRSFGPRLLPLGRSRPYVRAAIIAYVLMASVLPLAALVLVSLQPFWTADLSFAQLGFANYRATFLEDPLLFGAFRRSLLLGLASATVGVGIAVALTLFAATSRTASKSVGGLVSLPAALSHVVMAVGIILAYSGRPFALAGTSVLLFIAYVVIYLPQSFSAASSAYAQLGHEVVEASRVAGAGPVRTLRKIQLPLMTSGLVAAWILLFVLAMADLTASVMLAGTNNGVLGSTILDLYENGTFPKLAALAVVMTLVSAGFVALTMRLAARGTLKP